MSNSQVVHKYEVPIGESSLSLPKSSKIIHADFQRDKLMIWVMKPVTDKPTPMYSIPLKVVLTGQTFNYSGMTYFTTCTNTDNFVVHILAGV
jgi:hypothetical protein